MFNRPQINQDLLTLLSAVASTPSWREGEGNVKAQHAARPQYPWCQKMYLMHAKHYVPCMLIMLHVCFVGCMVGFGLDGQRWCVSCSRAWFL
jgi:hypothetical protein